jgi:hypothetical protein
VSVPPGGRKTLLVETTRNVFAYVFGGSGYFSGQPPSQAANRSLVLFGNGDEFMVEAGGDGVRFLLVSGMPLKEPVAWRGPIVMNTHEQLRQAFEELDRGTFLRAP